MLYQHASVKCDTANEQLGCCVLKDINCVHSIPLQSLVRVIDAQGDCDLQQCR